MSILPREMKDFLRDFNPQIERAMLICRTAVNKPLEDYRTGKEFLM
jgi:hypothetical protein